MHSPSAPTAGANGPKPSSTRARQSGHVASRQEPPPQRSVPRMCPSTWWRGLARRSSGSWGRSAPPGGIGIYGQKHPGRDRKNVGKGTRVSVRVELVGRRNHKKKQNKEIQQQQR